MNRQLSATLARALPRALVMVGGAGVLTSASWAIWVWQQPAIVTASPTTPASPSPSATGSLAPAREWVLSERALAATLVDELFPKPPAPPPPAEPPRLDVQLVAILGEGDRRRAFIRDTRENAYLELDTGSTLRDQIVLASIEADAATFTVGGTPVRLELAK